MQDSDRIQRAQAFWTWFVAVAPRFAAMLQTKTFTETEYLLSEMQQQLGVFNGHLGFRLGGSGPFELIITAEGDARYFDEVDALVGAAPIVSGWKMTALVPGRSLEGISYQMDDVNICEHDIFFCQLTDRVAFYVVDPKYRDDDDFRTSILRIAEAGVGERVFSAIRNCAEVLPMSAAGPVITDSLRPLAQITTLVRHP